MGGQFVNRYIFDIPVAPETEVTLAAISAVAASTDVAGSPEVARKSWMSITNFKHPAASFVDPAIEKDASKITAGKCGDKWQSGALPKTPHPALPVRSSTRPRGLRESSVGSPSNRRTDQVESRDIDHFCRRGLPVRDAPNGGRERQCG